MLHFILTASFLYIFGIINLFGVRPDLVQKQLILTLIGLVLFILLRYSRAFLISQNSILIYAVGLVLLVLTLFFGTEINGAKRWIDFGFFQLQTSEVYKLSFLLFFAMFLSPIRSLEKKRFLLLNLFLFLIPGLFLIFVQPDLGTTLLFASVFIVLIAFSEVPKKHMLYFAICMTIIIPLFWNFMQPYQKNRILSFVNPQQQTEAVSYNMRQSIITVGSGKIFGKGLGVGTQSKLLFLPEKHTDFAFASLVEQFGFIGGIIVLTLQLSMILYLLKTIYKNISSQDLTIRFKYFYTIGFTTFYLLLTVINIGMNLGMLPIAGLPLPFISYGGTFMVILIGGFGLIL